MAATTKLVMTFTGTNNNDVTLSYNYAKSDASTANIKSLIQGIITNGSIFSNPPVSAKEAKLITTTETEVDLNS